MTKTRNVMMISTLTLLLAVTGLSRAQQSPEAALRAAIETEMTRGLTVAIEQYKQVVDQYSRRAPATAAQALIRMAESYQKLGDPQSRALYERVVREFSEQKDAVALARTRLGEASPQATGIGLRKIYEGDFLAAVSPDGRFMIHHNGEPLDAEVLRDLSTGAERRLDVAYVPGDSVFSPDGAQVAYGTCQPQTPDETCEVRVVNARMAGEARPRRLYVSKGSAYIGPIDWSPDGKWIAVYIQRSKEQVLQLGMLRVSDGTLRVLQSVGWGGIIHGFFSPDGDLAFSLRMTEDSGARDIFLMDIEGTRQTPLVTNSSDDFPLGWTPDGKHLLFGSNRNGPIGVWAQPVANRKPLGAPTLVKPNLGGEVYPVGVTRSGTLYVGMRQSSQDVEIAPIDLKSGKADGSPYPISSPADRTWLPAWSPDGKSLAFMLVRNGENILGIRSALTGAERELSLGRELDRAEIPSWAPDGLSLAVWGRDLKGRYGIFRIDAKDGHVTSIVFQDPPRVGNSGMFWSSDGKKMYYTKAGKVFEREGEIERLVMANDQEVQYANIGVSPDRRSWAMFRLDRTTNSGALIIQPSGGGDSRVLHRFAKPEDFVGDAPQWTPDGSAVLVLQKRGDGERELLRVPLDGTTPQTLEFDLKRMAEFLWLRLSPDGRQLAYMVGGSSREVWAVENFASMLK